MRTIFKVYLQRDVHADFPFSAVAKAGIHDAVANQHGAVAVVMENGELLGVKPGEFERVERP